MEISHEVPIDLLLESRAFNDYDYALVHLFEEHKGYYDFFKESLMLGRKVILDNSLFELGEAFNESKYKTWIDELQPTHFIIPDAFDNMDYTIKEATKWSQYSTPHSSLDQRIVVCQGETYEEIKKCYTEFLRLGYRYVAFNFSSKAYQVIVNSNDKLFNQCYGRFLTIQRLQDEGVLSKYVKHHLLGCSLPKEFSLYKDNPYINSIDTSNPVVSAIEGQNYQDVEKIYTKSTTKLIHYIADKIQPIIKEQIFQNIKTFQASCRK